LSGGKLLSGKFPNRSMEAMFKFGIIAQNRDILRGGGILRVNHSQFLGLFSI